jgi:hypothetical protein
MKIVDVAWCDHFRFLSNRPEEREDKGAISQSKRIELMEGVDTNHDRMPK